MTNSEQAIREFAKKWGKGHGGVSEDVRCLLDLTALISEHYVAREDVNQEVEKRIAERMPTTDDAENAQLTYERKQTDCLDRFSYIHCYRDFMAGIEWLRSRLVSQKTEGGGE